MEEVSTGANSRTSFVGARIVFKMIFNNFSILKTIKTKGIK